MSRLDTLNRWAKLSCDKWNQSKLPPVFRRGPLKTIGKISDVLHKISRRFYRKRYRHAAQKYWQSVVGQNKTKQYQDGYYYFNTYPWPYSDPDFANWEEDDRTGSYTLISDQSNFIIRHPTSYCAWKIFESTGHWPKRKTPRGEKLFHAKYWQEFLAEAGYETIVVMPQSTHRYVGIEEHSETEFGEVVWFEKLGSVSIDESGVGKVVVSTYRDKQYFVGAVDPQKYLWIQII